MNIVGIGTDVVNIERIAEMLKRHPDRFKEKVFTELEYEYAIRKSNGDSQALASTLAARWAAKEAVAKALGTGFGGGLYWKNIEIISDGEAPKVQLHDVPEALQNKTFMLSMSHDYPTAVAFAMVLE